MNNIVIYEWDVSGLPEDPQDPWYTIRLRAYDVQDKMSEFKIPCYISENSFFVGSGLRINFPVVAGNVDQDVITSPSTDVVYEKLSGGITGLSQGKLYANNKLHNSTATIENGRLKNTFNAAEYNGGWVYPEGSVVFLYTQAKDATSGDIYSTGTQQSIELTDTFESGTKIEQLSNVQRVNGAMRLINTGTAGYFENKVITFAGDVSYVDLIVDQTGSVSYQISVDGGSQWQAITPVSVNGGETKNYANRKYFTTSIGNNLKVRAALNPGSQTPIISSWTLDVRYTTYVNAVLVDNTFPQNARGMTKLNHTYHSKTNESIKLDLVSPPTYYTFGSVESTVRLTSNDVIEACLEVEENKPVGTNIRYYISTQAGADDTWHEMTPGNAGILDDWDELSDPGTQIVIKAELTGDGTMTPELLRWRLSIKEKIAGQAYMVKLVDEPWNLSTLTGANYMTLLRWEESKTDGVTYNVYRSTNPHFELSAETLAAKGISGASWNDYNLNYRQTFYYKVTAVKSINGHDRESLPSNEAWAKVVSEGEVDKRLGLQNYWSYTGFGTGSGTGYVNVSNGNLVYTTTDMVVSDPFFATVMRRTFNSMADTKTAMGYGWDFSFNTCLLREYQADGVTEKGMILKDGDGSFHRFPKNGSVYDSAKGTFMELTFNNNGTPLNTSDDEYQIKRKDNITYHFNAQSMKLESFTDNNGNALSFHYDVRGNLDWVENTVGDRVTLKYHVEGVAPNGSDYTYVNYHPDMLESVTWTEDTQDNPAQITYNYVYNDEDRLIRAYTTIEDEAVYEETLVYDEVTHQLLTISDPEDKETDISYNASGEVDRITSANGDYYEYAYTDLGYNSTELRHEYKTSVTSKYDACVQYKYDQNGLLFEKDDPLFDPAHPLEHCIKYTHNDDYLVTGMSYYNNVNGGAAQLIPYSYEYTNDGKGNLHSITGPDGTQTTYGEYNRFNKPASVSVKKSSTETLTTYYKYDNGNLTNGNLTEIKDPENKVTTNTYGTVNGHFGYLTQVQGDFGNQTRYAYDDKGRVTEVNEYNNGTFVRTATTYDYDYKEEGYFLRVIATDAMGNSVKSYYDMLGRAVKAVYPDNEDDPAAPDVYERWSYDLVGNLTWARATSGQETTYEYDDMHRLKNTHLPDGSTTRIDYLKWNSDNNAATGDASGKDADNIVNAVGRINEDDVFIPIYKTASYYDIAGRLDKTSTINGTSEIISAQYQYDLIGNCTQVTDNAGRISRAQYNALGQMNKTIIDPSGMNIQTSYNYDWLGNQKSVTDGEGYTTWYSYDNDSRLKMVKQVNPYDTGENDGIDPFYATVYSYDNQGTAGVIKNSITRTTIDEDENIVSNGAQVSETWFDPMGRKVKDRNDGVTTDSTVMDTSYTYNANFQTEIVTRNDGTKEKYIYNAFGKVKRVDYYEAGESTAQPSDDYIVYDYNNSGQVELESVYRGGEEESSTSYTYDAMGRVERMTQGGLGAGGLTTNYFYDDAGRVHYISYSKSGTQSRTLQYDYDGFGRLLYIKLALGDAPASADDTVSGAQTVRLYEYKTNGELDYIKDFRNFEEDPTDYIKRVYVINNAGLNTNITYTDHENGAETGVVKESYTLTYDKRGFVTSETASLNYGEAKTISKSYAYDSLGRLLTATVDNNVDDPKTNTYTFDKVGNRLSMNDGTDTFGYEYDPTGFNRLKTIKKNGDTYTSYEYDDRGNQTQEVTRLFSIGSTHYNKTTKYAYDLANMLSNVSIKTPEADSHGNVTYKRDGQVNSYNAAGQRVSREDSTWNDKDGDNELDIDYEDEQTDERENEYDTEFYYTGSAILYTATSSNWLMTENILTPGGEIIASARFGEDPGVPMDYYFYNYDKQGSTTAILQPDGALKKGYEYDEFGNLEQSGDTGFLNDVTFTGSVTDMSTGMQYMNARYYNPKTGRFLSQDSYSGNPYDPWTQHLYSYCGNNPTNFVDPTGHSTQVAYIDEYGDCIFVIVPNQEGENFKPYTLGKGQDKEKREAEKRAIRETEQSHGYYIQINQIREIIDADKYFGKDSSYTADVLNALLCTRFPKGTNLLIQFMLQYDGVEGYGDLIDQEGDEFHLPYHDCGSLDKSSDCSSFVQNVAHIFAPDVYFGSAARSQLPPFRSGGRVIELEDLRPGDLIYYDWDPARRPASHVATYIGDGLMIHTTGASSESKWLRVAKLNTRDVADYIRVYDDYLYNLYILD